MEAEILANEDDKIEPMLGGYNSQNAFFVLVKFNADPNLYKDRTLKETIKNFQDMLQTGGINTNVFRNGNNMKKHENSRLPPGRQQMPTEDITFVVNDQDTASKVVQFFRGQRPYVIDVKETTSQGESIVGGEEPRNPNIPYRPQGRPDLRSGDPRVGGRQPPRRGPGAGRPPINRGQRD